MYDGRPEDELEELLDEYQEYMSVKNDRNKDGSDYTTWGTGYVNTPVYVLKDAVDRLKRYETIVHNLIATGNFLWVENLKSKGVKRVRKSDTPVALYKDETYKRMCMFVNRMKGEPSLDDTFLELVLAMSRVYTDDPTGLSQYLDREEKLFNQLEAGDLDG